MRMKINYRKAIGIASGILCSGCLALSALAAAAGGPSSNVWLDVVPAQSDARIRVEVPVSYGFVVRGTNDPTDPDADTAVTTANGNVLVSNVRVEVTDPDNGGVNIVTVGSPGIPLRNYSTDVREEHADEDNPPREGLPVSVLPFIQEVPETTMNGLVVNHFWKPVAHDPAGNVNEFKKYRMGLNGLYFENPGNITDENGNNVSVFFLGDELQLDAPMITDQLGWTAGGYALSPSNTHVPVDVQVGGVKKQYSQIEESAKVAVINWVITPGELPNGTTTP